ncbi:hypothetical protein L596_012042 [Steinernema carpocapsae]|uniref:Poly(A) RNA polymerase mitochondrial-like central palm domain-containing protein n=1 Tax=Steinernema carpocapsae TaxID=34508 RepID=A0A4U5NVU9_STECR|nr:hypothetical protein L596_012042 [Steinernema carpocapsae]
MLRRASTRFRWTREFSAAFGTPLPVDEILNKHAPMVKNLSSRVQQLSNKQKEEFTEWRTDVDDTLERLLSCYTEKKFFPAIVGSAMSGLANSKEGSDVDVVLYSSMEQHDIKRSRDSIMSSPSYSKKVLTGARDILKTSSLQYKTLVLLPSARFPILKVQLFRKNKKALVVDLMIDSMPNLRNSLFVQNASRSVDPRVHQLHLWVKQWLQVCGLVGSIQGLFSTYHTALLVIHFLQYIDHPDMKPVLPLMLDHFPRDLSPDTPFSDIYTLGTSPASFDPSSLESPNKMSIGDLIVRFVDFYNRTELSEFELNIPTGKNVRRKDDEFQRIMMIDPYDSRSVCAVEQGVGRLSEACQQTYEMFSAGRGFQVPFSFIRR